MGHVYYVDNHSIFRFVQGRDSRCRKHNLLTDHADPQWKQVLQDLRVRVTYALSAQAKGKIERPYRWLQDRLVRTCARDRITHEEAQQVLEQEEQRYNYRQVHSTTGEIPIIRFERDLRENQSLFREFNIPYPFQSLKDIFCFRINKDSRCLPQHLGRQSKAEGPQHAPSGRSGIADHP
jgi:hypothetical protein